MAKTQKGKHKSRIRQRKSRRIIGSRLYKNYSEEMLQLACELVKSNKMSSREAERQFDIPRRTITNKIKNKHLKSVGHPTVLSAAEENQIVKVLKAASNFGCPLTKIDLQLVVHEYVKKNSRDCRFKNGIPSNAWVEGFLARNANELTVRMTQNVSKARAEKGPQEIAEYFENLSTTLKDIPAENIINFDETNLSDDPGSTKAIFRRGVKYPERVANSTKGNISLMFTAIASGECLPLYVVYKSSSMYTEWVIGGPPETRYNCTKSGWFDSAVFEDYFEKIIIPWAQKSSGTKVIICDNLSSHLNVKVVELCAKNNIKFVFIPPRSTHLTQPLDVAFFGPVKKAWRKILYEYKLRNPNQTTLNKKHFPKLLRELLETIKIHETKNIKSGFRATGIFPFNPQEVLKKLPEMQEQVLSYGLDQVLVEYLKETRAPQPIQVKRNKKINCEPGKSVTVADLNVDSCKIKATKKASLVTKKQGKPKDSTVLDEKTGLFVTQNDFVLNNDANEDQEGCSEQDFSQDHDSYLDRNGDFSIAQHQDVSSPENLSKLCINVINSCMDQSVYLEKLSPTLRDFPRLKSFPKESVKKGTVKENKIIILSDVIIKAGTSNVSVLKEVSNRIENKSFISSCKSDIPECLKIKKNKQPKTAKKENSTKGKKVNIKVKVKNASKGKKSARKRISMKKRKNVSDSESNSIIDNDEVFTIDTDDSDFETIDDYLISECLREQEEKENFESIDIPFGLHEIEYVTENVDNMKRGDWIVAQFATKKTLKHFVGNILAINDKIPAVKFVRKVKESKCDEGTTFTYPIVDDICTMHHLEDIITILPKPKITRRGQIVFNVDFSNFNIQ